MARSMSSFRARTLLVNPQDFDDLALRAELRNEGIAVALQAFPEGLCRSS
jgi:hypothetical protein